MSDFFIEEVDWSDPENPIVTKAKLPFQIGLMLDKSYAMCEVTKLPDRFPLRKLLGHTEASIRILKGSKIRKIASTDDAANVRERYKNELKSIKGLSFSNRGDVKDKEFLTIQEDVEINDIRSIRNLGCMMLGTPFNAPEITFLMKDGQRTNITMRSVVGTRGEGKGPTTSTFSEVETRFATFDSDQPENAEKQDPPEVIEPPIDEIGGEEEVGDPPLDDRVARRVTVEEIEQIITELRLTQEQRDKILGGEN